MRDVCLEALVFAEGDDAHAIQAARSAAKKTVKGEEPRRGTRSTGPGSHLADVCKGQRAVGSEATSRAPHTKGVRRPAPSAAAVPARPFPLR